MSAPRVLGLDLSLTATGVAHDRYQTATISPGTLRGIPRLRFIRDRVHEAVTLGRVDLVAVEGPSYGSVGRGQHERGGLWWLIVYLLDDVGIPYAIVPPSVLKKYATGKGGASKPDMRMALYRRMAIDEPDDNKVDAIWLSTLGLDHLGWPPVDLPKAQRAALDKVTWPDLSAEGTTA